MAEDADLPDDDFPEELLEDLGTFDPDEEDSGALNEPLKSSKSPKPPKSTKPSKPAKEVGKKETAVKNDDSDDLSDAPAKTDPPKRRSRKDGDEGTEKKTSWRKSLGGLDYIGLIASAAILLTLAGLLLSWMYGRSYGEEQEAYGAPDLPIQGKVCTISNFDSYWKESIDPAKVQETIIPEAKMKVGGSGTGYLRILFFDSDERLVGDPRMVRITNGKLSSMNTGETISGDSVLMNCSQGFNFAPQFAYYLSSDDMDRWHMEIAETPDYQAKEWAVLARVAVANTKGGQSEGAAE